jgi:prepilin-type N-terminal cleavage/methylation domain-containing protein
MVRRAGQAGFTLVEVVIVLAISSLLVAAAIVGQGALRDRTGFTGAIDQIKNRLMQTQNEASNPVIDPLSNLHAEGFGNSDSTVFGKIVEFNNRTDTALQPNETGMTVSTLIAADGNTGVGLRKCDTTFVPFSESARYQGSSSGKDRQAIIFTSQPGNVFTAPDDYTEVPTTGAPTCSTVASTYSPPPPPPTGGGGGTGSDGSLECSGTAADPYQCGLKAEYYRGVLTNNSSPSPLGPQEKRTPYSIYLDDSVGSSLGNGEKSYPNFESTLMKRTGQPFVQYASVAWTGQIHLTPGAHVLCTESNTANTTAPVAFSGLTLNNDSLFGKGGIGEQCLSYAAPSDGWYPITVVYIAVDTENASDASMRLYENPDKNEIKNADLRTKPFETQAAANYARGLVGDYYSNAFLIGSPHGTYNDTDLGSGFTYPDFSTTLRQRTGLGLIQPGLASVKWSGYFMATKTANYDFCTEADDGARLIIDGVTLVSDWGTPHSAALSCSNVSKALTAGLHPIEIDYQDNCGSLTCVANVDRASLRLFYRVSGSAVTEVPDNLFSREVYSYVVAPEAPRPTDMAFKNAPRLKTVSAANGRALNVVRRLLLGLPMLVSRSDHQTTTSDSSQLLTNLLTLSQIARAAGSYDVNILNSDNYTTSNDQFRKSASLKFIQDQGTTEGRVTIDPAKNTISRSFPN